MSSDHPAVRLARKSQAAVVARDWQAVADDIADDFRFEDRRSGLQSSGGKAENIQQMRVIVELGLTRIDWETIETRGERFALGRMTFHVSDFTVAALGVVGIDSDGRFLVGVVFDDDDLDAAHAELEARSAT